MREFDYKDRYKKVLTPDIVALISKIHEFKGGTGFIYGGEGRRPHKID